MTAGRRRSCLLLSVLGLVAVASLLVPARAAGAHAVLISSNPPPGALVDEAPAQVSIRFNEPVQLPARSLTVIDGTGQVVSSAPRADGTTISVDVPAGGEGWFAVSWRVVSADGHPLSGAWTYRVGDGAAEPPSGLEDRAAAAAGATVTARWGWVGGQLVSTLGAAVLVGTLFLAALGLRVERAARPGLAAAAGVAAIGGSLAASAFNGPFSAGGGTFAELFTGPVSGPYLARSLLATAATVVVVAWGSRRRPGAWLAWALAAAAVVAVPAWSGHAAADGAVARVAVAAHLVVGTSWLGAMPGLVLAVRERSAPVAALAARFSLAAGRLLAATVVFGAVGAVVLAGGLDEVDPTWGRLLALKLALVVVAVAAGTWNRWRVLPGGDVSARLARPLAVEAVALVAIVATSIALTHNGPPREVAAGPAVVDVAVADDLRVQLVVDPARTGANWVHLYTLDPAGMPVEVEAVTVTFAAPQHGIEPIPQVLSDAGNGHHLGISHDLGLPGTWEVGFTVRPDRFTEVAGTGVISVSS